MSITAFPLLLAPEVRQDPYPLYAALRREAPVHWDPGLGRWVVSRYADVAALLRDPRLSSERGAALNAGLPPAVQEELAPTVRQRANTMLFSDPPKHTRLRRLVNKAFTPRIVEALRASIQAQVDALLDAAVAKGELEVIHDFAYPLPATVIAGMLGAPPEDRDQFKTWSDDIALALTPESAAVALRAQQSGLAMGQYMSRIVADRRVKPCNDLISALLAAEEHGDPLSEEELYAMCALLLIAGHETTTNLIANGLLALLRWPDELARLRAEPDLLKPAVEELLRYDSPIQGISRVLLEDVALHGERMRAGAPVVLLTGAANRDPAQFSDPDRLDVERADNRHLAFGGGIHYCLGAPLARLEGQIAFATLLRRFPVLRLASAELTYKRSLGFRALTALPVAFEV